jgi:flagellar basal-body rod protein FlgB
MPLFDTTYDALNLALGAAGKRHEVLSNNIANVNTPGYKRQDVSFEASLAEALDGADGRSRGVGSNALDGVEHSVVTNSSTSMRLDGNNVDIDHEMAQLAENNVRYNALVQLASKKLSAMRYVISDGRR